jgi:hypothetical protein
MKTFDFIQATNFHHLKDPHSKSLEPDCLSPYSCDCDTVSERREEGVRYFDHWCLFGIWCLILLPILYPGIKPAIRDINYQIGKYNHYGKDESTGLNNCIVLTEDTGHHQIADTRDRKYGLNDY